MEFRLSITLGNDAMRTPEDVGIALREVRARIGAHLDYFDSDTSGTIRDANGNTVGTWEVVGE